MRAREWKGVAGMEEGKTGESLTLRAEGARPSAAAAAAGEEPARLATPPKTRPPAPAPAPHRLHPAPRRRSGSPAGTSQLPPGPPRLCAAPLGAGALFRRRGEGVEGVWEGVWGCGGVCKSAWGPPCLSRTLRSPLSRQPPGSPRSGLPAPGTWRRSPGHLPCCHQGGEVCWLGKTPRLCPGRWVYGGQGRGGDSFGEREGDGWGGGSGAGGERCSVPAAPAPLRLLLLRIGVSGRWEGQHGHSQPMSISKTVACWSGGKIPSFPHSPPALP